MYLFFDTETTGLPNNYNAPPTDTANWPRLIQIGWTMHDSDGREIGTFQSLIKPEGFEIPAAASSVHGITTERATMEGLEVIDILHRFSSVLSMASQIVGHNISYDVNIVAAEYVRAGMENPFKNNLFCTMKNSTEFCKLPGPRGFKWPRLEQLHMAVFSHGFEGAHDALTDVRATARCFFELKQRGVF